jgi:transposase
MSEITTIGLDLAKHVFQVHGIDAQGTTVLRKRLRRGQELAFFSRIPRCVVGLEACATAHYWARELGAIGHEVRLMPAQYVRRTSNATSPTPPMRKRFARRLGDRPRDLCRSRRPTSKLPCCCTVAGSGWCASVWVW